MLAVDAVIRDQQDVARDHLAELPDRGLSILYGPLLNAWLEVGAGDLEAAQDTAAGLDGRDGFESLYLMHKALLYDVGGDPAQASEAYRDLLGRLDSPSLRFAVLAGNFFERQGEREAGRRYLRPVLPGQSRHDPAGFLRGRRAGRGRARPDPQHLSGRLGRKCCSTWPVS